MTAVTPGEVERIVKAVMAELQRSAPQLVPALVPAAAPAASAATAEKPMPVAGDLIVDSRVVAMSDIADRLAGKRRLVVQQTALVTPAVIDELRRKGVALERGNAQTAQQSGAPSVLVVSGRTKQSAAAVLRLLEQEGVAVRHEQSECMIVATDSLADAVGDGKTLGVLWTRLTAMGICLANRHPGVRAVLAGDAASTLAAVESVGANVLVLDPAAGTEFQRKQIVRDFCRGGPRRCPETLASRLG